MPSHITHALFALEVKQRLDQPVDQARWLLLGSQGPDMFLHNRRRYPNTVSWGRRIHQEGYGRFVQALSAHLRKRGLGWESPEGLFVQGYVTHAVLDRNLHPYIHAASYRSGARHLLLHPFLERLIDVELLRSRRVSLPETPFSRNIDLGEEIPDSLKRLLQDAVGQFEFSSTDQPEVRISNAYRDARDLLLFTDHLGSQQLKVVFSRETREERLRLLSLFHPSEVPLGLDVLNRGGRAWAHPWQKDLVCSVGVEELYEQSLEQAGVLLSVLLSEQPGSSRIAGWVGNENLNGSRADRDPPGMTDSWLHLEQAAELRYQQLGRLPIKGDLVQ